MSVIQFDPNISVLNLGNERMLKGKGEKVAKRECLGSGMIGIVSSKDDADEEEKS